MRRPLLVLLAVFAWAGNAHTAAADPVTANWTGFYVGGNVGSSWLDQNVSLAASDPTLLPFSPFAPVLQAKFSASSAIGGVQFGYNVQPGANWLIGFETDFDWSNLKDSASFTGAQPNLVVNADARLSWFGTVRARIGYLPADHFLLYGTGGFAYGRVVMNGAIVNNGGPIGPTGPGTGIGCLGFATCMSGSSNATATGWTLGGGFEYEFWRHVTFKVEYLYVNLGSHSFTVGVITPPNGTSTLTANPGDTTFNVVRAGLNYRF